MPSDVKSCDAMSYIHLGGRWGHILNWPSLS